MPIGSVVFPVQDGKKKEKGRHKKSRKGYISPIREEAYCEQMCTKFCMSGDMPDVIICAKIEVKKLRGLGFTGVKFWVLPLKWLVTLTIVLRYCATCDCDTTSPTLLHWKCSKRKFSIQFIILQDIP